MSKPPGRGRSILEMTSQVAFTEIESLFKGMFLDKESRAEHILEKQKRIAEIIFSQMGQLKGTGLKLLQVLSLDENLLPPTFIKKFENSYGGASAMSRAVVKKIIKNEFEDSAQNHFLNFNYSPIAAASIGQVHRATLTDGIEVAVKIQYPSVAEQTQFDISVLRKVADKFSQPLLKSCIHELASQLLDEVDYNMELKNLTTFHSSIQLPGIHIPTPVPQLSTQSILTMTLLDGVPLSEIPANKYGSEALNQTLQLIFNLFTHTLFNKNILHSDPHPGNYLQMTNGDLGVVDFGSVKQDIDPRVSQLFKLILSVDGSESEIVTLYKELGAQVSTSGKEFYEKVVKSYRQGCHQILHKESCSFAESADSIRALRSSLFSQVHNSDLQNFSAEFTMIHKSFLSILLMIAKFNGTISTRLI